MASTSCFIIGTNGNGAEIAAGGAAPPKLERRKKARREKAAGDK